MSIFQKSLHFYEKTFQAERFIFIDYLNVHISKDLNPKGYMKIIKNVQAERFIFIVYLNVYILKDLNPKGYIKFMKNGQNTA